MFDFFKKKQKLSYQATLVFRSYEGGIHIDLVKEDADTEDPEVLRVHELAEIIFSVINEKIDIIKKRQEEENARLEGTGADS